MNIREILSTEYKKGKLNKLDVELILAFVLKKSREYIFIHSEDELSPKQISNFKIQISKRARNYPLAYITGQKEFYGNNFKVNKNVLIPRPETELMIDLALRYIDKNKKHTIIDIGTGSGCIIITLAKSAKGQNFFGCDISKKALSVARQNAKLNGINNEIKFIPGDLLEPLFKNLKLKTMPTGRQVKNSKILILANLPYLTKKQIKDSPTIKHEPKLALDGGKKGLEYYQEFFIQTQKLRQTLPQPEIILLIEIDESQTGSMKQLLSQNKFTKFKFFKDLQGLDRTIAIWI